MATLLTTEPAAQQPEAQTVGAQEVAESAALLANQETSTTSKIEGSGTLVLILIGRVGAGKSSTGNTILGADRGSAFAAKRAATAVTRKCQVEEVFCGAGGDAEAAAASDSSAALETLLAGQRLLLLDTPGLGDNATGDDELYSEIRRGLSEMVPDGAKVSLVLVLSVASRVGEDEMSIMAQLRHHIFGHGMLPITTVVWTHGDLLDEGMEINDYLKDVDPTVRDFLAECGGGHVMVTNKSSSGSPEQVQTLLTRVVQVAGKLPSARADAGKRVAGRKSARRHRQMEAGLLSPQHQAKLESALKKKSEPAPQQRKESSCAVS